MDLAAQVFLVEVSTQEEGFDRLAGFWAPGTAPEPVAQTLNSLAGFTTTKANTRKPRRSLSGHSPSVNGRWAPSTPHVGTSPNNLAELRRNQGQCAQAAALFERALAIREKTLGPEHPDVAYSLSNLAERYRDQGRYEEAEALYRQSLDVLEGPNHPNVARCLEIYARLLRATGRPEATSFEARARAIRTRHAHQIGP
jgi:tetratricopeptide (TPR) repeat protein